MENSRGMEDEIRNACHLLNSLGEIILFYNIKKKNVQLCSS